MTGNQGPRASASQDTAATRETLEELGTLLRTLRRRHARERSATPLTYRELAARTGWSLGAVWDYFAGRILPPTDRLDALAQLLGAAPAEQRQLADLRDRVEERRYRAALGHAPGAAADHAGAVRVVPRQLPTPPGRFVGRLAHLDALDALACDRDDRVAVAVIAGMAGVGKSALAVHWAHRASALFPDGQLYLDLRGFAPELTPVAPADAVHALLDALQIPPGLIPVGLDARVALYRSVLAGRRILVVLDNAYEVDQVRPLLPTMAGCMAVVTSRRSLSSLVSAEGAHP